MPTIKDVINSEDFKNLSPEAKKIVFDKVSAQDADFQALSPEARNIVSSRVLGTSPAQAPEAAQQPNKSLLQRAR